MVVLLLLLFVVVVEDLLLDLLGLLLLASLLPASCCRRDCADGASPLVLGSTLENVHLCIDQARRGVRGQACCSRSLLGE